MCVPYYNFGNTLVPPFQVVEQTIEVGTQTAANLKGQVNAKHPPISSFIKHCWHRLNSISLQNTADGSNGARG